MLANEIFLDAAYAIALSAPRDRYHERAEMLAEQLEAKGTLLITTRAVVLEILRQILPVNSSDLVNQPSKWSKYANKNSAEDAK